VQSEHCLWQTHLVKLRSTTVVRLVVVLIGVVIAGTLLDVGRAKLTSVSAKAEVPSDHADVYERHKTVGGQIESVTRWQVKEMTYADYKSATSPDPTLGSSHAPPAAQHPFRTPTNAPQAPSQSPEEAAAAKQHADALARELADPAQGHDVYVIAEQGDFAPTMMTGPTGKHFAWVVQVVNSVTDGVFEYRWGVPNTDWPPWFDQLPNN
jgi:hypothetical protein